MTYIIFDKRNFAWYSLWTQSLYIKKGKVVNYWNCIGLKFACWGIGLTIGIVCIGNCGIWEFCVCWRWWRWFSIEVIFLCSVSMISSFIRRTISKKWSGSEDLVWSSFSANNLLLWVTVLLTVRGSLLVPFTWTKRQDVSKHSPFRIESKHILGLSQLSPQSSDANSLDYFCTRVEKKDYEDFLTNTLLTFGRWNYS